MDYGNLVIDIDNFNYRHSLVVIGGEYWFRCCERLQKMECVHGVWHGECDLCGREYVVGE